MTQLWWFVARSTGLVAWALLTVSVLWGLTLSTRSADRPVWVEALHRWVGGLSVLFLAGHLVSLLLDSYVHFSVAQVLVPFLSTWKPWPVALGIVALYATVAVELTSLARRRLPRRAWRAVHLVAYAGFWMGTAHGVLAGTDTANPLLFGLYGGAGVAVLVLTLYRILATRAARRSVLPTSS